MVRLVELRLGLLPFAHEETPPRPRWQQVHLVRLHLQRFRLLPQPDREAREVRVLQSALRLRYGVTSISACKTAFLRDGRGI